MDGIYHVPLSMLPGWTPIRPTNDRAVHLCVSFKNLCEKMSPDITYVPWG